MADAAGGGGLPLAPDGGVEAGALVVSPHPPPRMADLMGLTGSTVGAGRPPAPVTPPDVEERADRLTAAAAAAARRRTPGGLAEAVDLLTAAARARETAGGFSTPGNQQVHAALAGALRRAGRRGEAECHARVAVEILAQGGVVSGERVGGAWLLVAACIDTGGAGGAGAGSRDDEAEEAYRKSLLAFKTAKLNGCRGIPVALCRLEALLVRGGRGAEARELARSHFKDA